MTQRRPSHDRPDLPPRHHRPPTGGGDVAGDRVRRYLAGLSAQPKAPDLAGSILDAVEQRRGFASRAERRRRAGFRWAAAALLVAGIGSAFIVQNATPARELAGVEPQPIARLVADVPEDTNATIAAVRSTVDEINRRVADAPRRIVMHAATIAPRARPDDAETPRTVRTIAAATTPMPAAFDPSAPLVVGIDRARGVSTFDWNAGVRPTVGIAWPSGIAGPTPAQAPSLLALPASQPAK